MKKALRRFSHVIVSACLSSSKIRSVVLERDVTDFLVARLFMRFNSLRGKRKAFRPNCANLGGILKCKGGLFRFLPLLRSYIFNKEFIQKLKETLQDNFFLFFRLITVPFFYRHSSHFHFNPWDVFIHFITNIYEKIWILHIYLLCSSVEKFGLK